MSNQLNKPTGSLTSHFSSAWFVFSRGLSSSLVIFWPLQSAHSSVNSFLSLAPRLSNLHMSKLPLNVNIKMPSKHRLLAGKTDNESVNQYGGQLSRERALTFGYKGQQPEVCNLLEPALRCVIPSLSFLTFISELPSRRGDTWLIHALSAGVNLLSRESVQLWDGFLCRYMHKCNLCASSELRR